MLNQSVRDIMNACAKMCFHGKKCKILGLRSQGHRLIAGSVSIFRHGRVQISRGTHFEGSDGRADADFSEKPRISFPTRVLIKVIEAKSAIPLPIFAIALFNAF
jgi:hypothetical protein